jgi:membrane fusion protein, macrolide-specific efflux system
MSQSRIRIWVINLLILVLVVGAGFWGWSATHPKAGPAQIITTTATIGNVTSTVSASGTVISPGDVGVSPSSSGTIRSIDVKVGQHVIAGQLLATLDGTSLANSLAQAKATLASQQVQFQQDELAVTTAGNNLKNAQDLATSNQTTYQSTIAQAQTAVTNAQANRVSDKAADDATIAADQQTVTNAQITYNNYYNTWSPYGFTTGYCSNLSLYGVNTTTANDTFTHCQTIQSNQQALTNAQNALANAQAAEATQLAKDDQNISSLQQAVVDAQNSTAISIKKDQQSIQTAQVSLQQAQAALALFKAQNGITSDTPTASDFTAAQAALKLAQQNYDGTFVHAPVTGDIASITGSVGGVASTAASSTVGSVSGMFVITNVSSLEVQAGFSESDAAKLKVGQPVSITFDAISGVTATGSVLNIDLLPTTTSGATTYNAEFTIDGKVPGLKPGMTATVSVLVGSADNVLSLPAQAVNIRNSGATVTVVTTKGGVQVQTRTPVVVGLQGDSQDQILSGITAGTKVVLRTISTSSSTFPSSSVPSVTGGGGFGGGGGGFGGGGAVRGG